MQKRSIHVPTESYFYLARHIDKCMTRLNICVGPARTQITNAQKMNNYEKSKQKIPNLQVCSSDERKTKGTNMDGIISHVFSTEKR